MNVLFIANDPALFTEGSAVRARMQAYADAIGELHIVSPAPRSGDIHAGNLHLYSVRAPRFMRVHALANRARPLIREHGIQVVSAQDPFEHGLAARKAVEGTEAKLHVQVHTDFLSPWFVRGGVFRSPKLGVPSVNRIRVKLAGQVLPKAAGVRVVSKRIKESLMEAYGARVPEPAVIPIATPNACPPAVPLPFHPFPFAFITVSRLESEKRIDDILVALARIKDQYPAVGLVVVGEGRARRHLEQQARALALADRVLFLGARPDAWGLMRSAQAYVQASAYEGYGITLVEAALAGLPIITTDVGIVGEVFSGYEDVLAAPPGDPAALATHMRGIIEDPATRLLISRSARAKAEAHLATTDSSPAAIAADLARLIA